MSQYSVTNIDIVDDESSTCDDSTIDTSHTYNKHRGYEDVIVDPDCRTFLKSINSKRRKISYYVTNMNGRNTIRDAITGMYYKNYKVGSLSENVFFKVSFCQGNHASNNGISQNGETLFYMSPSDYEKHMKVRLPTDDKDAWKIKSDECMRNLTLRSSRKNM